MTLLAVAAMAFTAAACSSSESTTQGQKPAEEEKEDNKGDEKPQPAAEFAKGADISWVTEMESRGMTFKNRNGEERECTALMKELGMNSIRLRVWVDPADGWCNKEDVLVKALRAHKLGMRLMIDFHYSDSWADPAKQNIPAAWRDFNITEMKQAVADHTVEVLTLLKENGIDVEWVQVGNETTDGMLWEMGRCSKYPANYAKLNNAGYDAVKSVYPDATVIVHVDRGDDLSRHQWLFGELKKNGGKFDMIGMSLYPSYIEKGWRPAVEDCLRNIKTLSKEFSCRVMVCEVGMPWDHPDAKAMLSMLISGARATELCDGVFYWEPEAPNGYNGGYSLGAFADGMPTEALDAFKE